MVSFTIHIRESLLISEQFGDTLLIYVYDEAGSPIGFKYRTTGYAIGAFDSYVFEKNLQGGIIAIYNTSGTAAATYKYDSWGNVIPAIIYREKGGHMKINARPLNEGETFVCSMKKAKEIGKIPVSMGIDTWGVDYALVDENGDLIDKMYGYRDSRTDGMDDEVYKIIPEKEGW